MPIDSYTFQCYIHSQLQISELYSNCITSGVNLKSPNLKNFIHYSLNMLRYAANLLKIWIMPIDS